MSNVTALRKGVRAIESALAAGDDMIAPTLVIRFVRAPAGEDGGKHERTGKVITLEAKQCH